MITGEEIEKATNAKPFVPFFLELFFGRAYEKSTIRPFA
jgi:hypothetical protein